MGLYSDKKDYQTMVTENIAKAKLIYGLNKEDTTKVLELLDEKNKIIEENKLFANFKLASIDKKINKIKQNSYKEGYNNSQSDVQNNND